VPSSCATIFWASATPELAELLLLGAAPVVELAALELELLLELHAASSAAVIAAPGASHRFHLCVIAM
jgi:hypothetical protein